MVINVNRPKTKFAIYHRRAPGDTLVLSGLVRDLALTYPGEFDVKLNVSAPSIFDHNPYILGAGQFGYNGWYDSDFRWHKADYGQGIRDQRNETIHFLSYFHRDFYRKTGIPVPVHRPYPDLHLSAAERQNRTIEDRYWVIVPGGKSDFVVKHWHPDLWQRVVDMLAERGIRCVQVGATSSRHWNPELQRVTSLVGTTSLRDTFSLIHHAEGVICGITMTMHAAAALQKPCVVLGGGLEGWYWEGYVNENTGFGPEASGTLAVPHRYLHTEGLLHCARPSGCWKTKVVVEEGAKNVCIDPLPMPGKTIPRCMAMITPDHVVEAVMSYYRDRSLPPINPTQFVPVLPAPTLPPPLVAAPPPRLASALPVLPTRAADPLAVLDHPVIGGRFTLFVLLYGEFTEIHRRCLGSILLTCPPNRVDLRVGSNALCPASAEYVAELVESGLVSTHYAHTANDKKYPVMREMFWDPDNPITTNYLIWFDDDTFCDKDALWLPKLAARINDHHHAGYRLYGPERIWKLLSGQKSFIQQAPWYGQRMFRNRAGVETADGAWIRFASGSCWALHTQTMRDCNIPDVRIGHNGGDYMIGEQIHQGGWQVKGFANHKEEVNWSAVPRRGCSEPHVASR